MILDRCVNALTYVGISPRLDTALKFLAGLEPAALAVNTRVELEGTDVFYSVGEPLLTHREMSFEHHKRYIDIHVPITGTERIALCPAAARPQDAAFDEQKDIGFFPGRQVNTVDVPAGWFCICFPDDAHVPGMTAGEDHAIVKVVVKVRA
ncbi:MAG: YhcH/YjgK/YiaL family protein [Clostridiales bacterium]|nr:YhcH/YjgK/YiaL family protein [Clostridiales bacterium]MDO4350617.1 YhcH/YjgK/YiaL family protein [Eubacteriales bacterium]MDY4009138.1 YhcH/YjgK/YiaL family protein [Candidatus Limiplasma sp.]